MSAPTDTEMLDFLDKQAEYAGLPVIFRWNNEGRGWRLMQDPHMGRYLTARDAIAVAMADSKTWRVR